jgi:hypothetical protein
MGWPDKWSSGGRAFSAEEMESYRFRLRSCLRYWLGGSEFSQARTKNPQTATTDQESVDV